ncbi:protein SMAX1-LIKE 8-like isoform X2 [Wolffia australiana]
MASSSPPASFSGGDDDSDPIRTRHNYVKEGFGTNNLQRRSMPAAASAARECLAEEAAPALDAAVALARRRGHAQTTPLHVLSALLSSPSSSLLRNAVNGGGAKLERRLSAALDRLPPAAPPDPPPVSNSLMAAVRRSQATQRRHPDAFSQQRTAAVKVELQQLVVAVLDDPAVGRVLSEAGFRSRDVKLSVIRPPPSALQLAAAGGRTPPLFLCNFDLTPRSFASPFSAADESCRRIAQVLARTTGRNPLLVGAGAGDAARDFERAVLARAWSSLPAEARGLELASIETEAAGFVAGEVDRAALDSRLAGVRPRSAPGAVVSFGDLSRLVQLLDRTADRGPLLRLGVLVNALKKLLDEHRGRVWLMGSAGSYEVYTKLLSLHPRVDKDLDLQLLPVASVRSSPRPVQTGARRPGPPPDPGPETAEPVSTDLALGSATAEGDSKGLYQSLLGKVPWQEEAARAVIRAAGRALAGRAVWVGLVGPDPVGKRKLAAALAESLFAEKMIAVDLAGLTQRGKTAVDCLAAELRRRGPAAVVFLENVDHVDLPARASLLRAVRTGRLADSFGREVSLAGAVFVAAFGPGAAEEAALAALPRRRLRLVVAASPAAKRRRRDGAAADDLDLNVPLEEEGYAAAAEELLAEMDERVETKAFDFAAVAAEVRRSAAGEVEIEAAAMDQILAAAWAADGGAAAAAEWVRAVLVKAVGGAAAAAAGGGSLRLVAGEAAAETDEQAPGIRLPARISFS